MGAKLQCGAYLKHMATASVIHRVLRRLHILSHELTNPAFKQQMAHADHDEAQNSVYNENLPTTVDEKVAETPSPW